MSGHVCACEYASPCVHVMQVSDNSLTAGYNEARMVMLGAGVSSLTHLLAIGSMPVHGVVRVKCGVIDSDEELLHFVSLRWCCV